MFTLQWMQALQSCGHQVLLVDFITEDEAGAVGLFRDVMDRWWNLSKCTLISAETGACVAGLGEEDVTAFSRSAHLSIRIGVAGKGCVHPAVEEIRPRIFIDQDPGYSHSWAEQYGVEAIFGNCDHYFTVGGNVGTPRCAIPTLGLDWHHVWNPVIMDWWSAQGGHPDASLTTVMSWGQHYFEFRGQILAPKAEQLREFIDLPERTGRGFELILDMDPAHSYGLLLQQHGWNVQSSRIVATPDSYREFILNSTGEFSCAQGGYVGTNSGWFSDRSACYLAAGRPVVLQNTGFPDILPVGEGLFCVSNVEEAVAAVESIRRNYGAHSQAARALAETYFSPHAVVPKLLSVAGIE